MYGEGQYNLNSIKDFRVSESFLGLKENVRNCQNEVTLEDCAAHKYVDALLGECKCLPFGIKHISEEKLFPLMICHFIFFHRLMRHCVKKIS